jgi:hypothetical protein
VKTKKDLGDPVTVPRQISNAALPVCLAAMDACWIYCVAWLFSTVVLSGVTLYPMPVPPVLAGLELAGWGLTTFLLDRTRLNEGLVRWVVGLAGVLVSVGVSLLFNPWTDLTLSRLGVWLGVAGYGVFVGAVLWGVGAYRASQGLDYETAYRTFRLGLIAVVLASFLASLLAQPGVGAIWEGVGGVALWFVGWSLCALALGNREALRQETGQVDTRFWGALLVGSLACVLLVAVASGSFTLGGVFQLIQLVVGTLVALVLLVVYWAVYALFWLMSLARLPIRPPSRTQTPTPTPTPAPITGETSSDWLERLRRQLDLSAPITISPELQAILTALTAILLVGLAAWLVSRGLGRTRRVRVKDAHEERESLGSWQLLWVQVRAWIDTLLERFRKSVTTEAVEVAEDDLTLLEGRPEWVGTLSVRQIYAKMQWLAGRLGYPRAPQQTPTEYLRVLSAAMPELRGDFTRITAAYIEARYGGAPVSPSAALAATEAWRRAEPTLQSAQSEQLQAQS